MDKLVLTPKGVKRVASGLLADNWGRAIATMFLSMFALSAFVMFNQLLTSLMNLVENIDSTTAQEAAELVTVGDYINNAKESGAILSYGVSAVIAAFYFAFVSPLNLGIVSWYQSLAQCGDLKVGQALKYYRSNDQLIDALVFELSRLGRNILVGGLSLAPSIVCFAMANSARNAEDAARASQMTLIGAAALVVGLLVYAMIILRWFLAKYVFTAGMRKSIGECFTTSALYMKGNKGQILRLFLSFIPAFISCLFLFPLVYVIPKYNASMAAAAQDIIDARTPV